MNPAVRKIFRLLAAANATWKRRFLVALIVTLSVVIPTYASIISNVTRHNVTVVDVAISSTPAVDTVNATGFTEVGAVTVSTPQTFSGRLTLTITNVTQGATGLNPASLVVTISTSPPVTIPGGKTIIYIGGVTSISNGTVIGYTVKFVSMAEDSVNGIQSGTTYQIQQAVGQ